MSKDKDNIIKNYLKKINLIDKYNQSYYEKDSPVVTDHQFDELKNEILDLERKHSYLTEYGSITSRVGYKPSSKFAKIKHSKPMLSLANAFDHLDIEDFEKKNKKLFE